MQRQVYKYHFGPQVPVRDFEDTLCLALIATESLHGSSVVQMECAFDISKETRTATIDASTTTGSDFAKIFTGLCKREFGSDFVTIEREAATCTCSNIQGKPPTVSGGHHE